MALFMSVALIALHRRAVILNAGAAAILPRIAHADEGVAARRCCLVVGATGRTGRYVVDALNAPSASNIDIIAGVRTEASRSRVSPGIAYIAVDVTNDDPDFVSSLSKEMLSRGVTDVICTLGFSPTFVPDEDRKLAEAIDYLGTLKLIQAAEAAKIPGRFVLLSSLGTNSTTQSARMLDSSLGGVLGQKALAERALRASPVLDWCIVRPGLLLKEKVQAPLLLGPEDRFVGDAVQDGRGLGDTRLKCASPFLASQGAVCAATRGQVAEVCVAALTGDAGLFSRRVVEVVARPVEEGSTAVLQTAAGFRVAGRLQ